jgi:hypothetical protein
MGEKMKAWKYKNGQWESIEDPLPDIDDWEEALKQGGFVKASVTWGGQFGQHVELYMSKDEEPPYMVSFDLVDVCRNVYFDDMPTLMQWLKEYTPIFTALEVEALLDDITAMTRKLFRALHGHDADQVCPECDPFKYKKLQEIKNRGKSDGQSQL